ncbi:MAG: IS1 family transposase [Blastocatellia bacterium]
MLYGLPGGVSKRHPGITAYDRWQRQRLDPHVERWNNTLRKRLARFVRKTLSFSKSDRMHEICLRLFIHRYNLSLRPI